jgi:hypothetical protein
MYVLDCCMLLLLKLLGNVELLLGGQSGLTAVTQTFWPREAHFTTFLVVKLVSVPV